MHSAVRTGDGTGSVASALRNLSSKTQQLSQACQFGARGRCLASLDQAVTAGEVEQHGVRLDQDPCALWVHAQQVLATPGDARLDAGGRQAAEQGAGLSLGPMVLVRLLRTSFLVEVHGCQQA